MTLEEKWKVMVMQIEEEIRLVHEIIAQTKCSK